MSQLSICIPAYNYANYLGIAIESCLREDFEFELVVLDNCSSDLTPSLRSKYEVDPRVRWFRNTEVLPIQQNWNKAVSLTTGKYVKLLQADDLLLPEFFRLFSNALTVSGNFAIFGHLAIIIDESGNEIRRQIPYGESKNYYSVSGKEALKLKLQQAARFKEPSCNFFIKNAWSNTGGYREDLRFTFDIAFNVKVASKFGGLLINEYGASLRRHSNSDGAKLPGELAVKEIKQLVSEIWCDLGEDISSKDYLSGNALIQYRIIELFLQRFKSNPSLSLRFLFSHLNDFKYFKSFPDVLKILIRKIQQGDVQSSFDSL